MLLLGVEKNRFHRKEMLMLNCIVVGLGGFVGAVLRFLFGFIPLSGQSGFPYKTFLINVIGAFVI